MMDKHGFSYGMPVHIRIFKEEAMLELWMLKHGRFAKLKTYPICAFSGNLGPKKKEGDMQAPEGFYHVTKEQMNPNSKYHLSFNLGYPNQYDQSHGRTGSFLMVHGDCVSRGCYAMTDKGIEEIYSLMHGAFESGQKRVQVEAYPFRMTAANIIGKGRFDMLDFWFNLKQGYDLFEASKLPSLVSVEDKNYHFTHTRMAASTHPLLRYSNAK